MQNRNQNRLDDEHIGRLLLRLSLPSFAGMFVMTLYNVVDTIFIGHYVGPLGIAGLSIVFPIQMLSMGIGHMTGMGGASLISRLIGRNDVPGAERTMGNATVLTVVFSGIIMVIGLAAPDYWLRLMGSSETILPYAHDYMTIILYGMFFGTFAMSQSSLIRAQGNARVPMLGMIMGAGLNIILDAVFIIPLHMGVQGAALATVIAMLISVIYFMVYSLSGRSFLKFHPGTLVLDGGIVKGILSIGIAAFAMTIANSLSGVIANRMIVYYGGDVGIAVFGILHRILMFALMPGIVIGTGMQPILGFNYGARRWHLALNVIKLAMVAATVACIAVFLVLYLLPDVFIFIFTTDAGVLAAGTHAIRYAFAALWLLGFTLVGSLIFQSIGKPVQSFITSVSRPALFTIPLILTLPRFWQLDGVWLAFPLADVSTFLLTLLLLIPQFRDFRKLAAETRELP